jgi:hypothetical protein
VAIYNLVDLVSFRPWTFFDLEFFEYTSWFSWMFSSCCAVP